MHPTAPEVKYNALGLTAGVGGYGSAGASPSAFIWGPFTNGDNFGVASFQYDFAGNSTGNSSSAPEPNTLFLFGFGLIGLAGFRRKMKNR